MCVWLVSRMLDFFSCQSPQGFNICCYHELFETLLHQEYMASEHAQLQHHCQNVSIVRLNAPGLRVVVYHVDELGLDELVDCPLDLVEVQHDCIVLDAWQLNNGSIE